jgi:hypothetical protein
MYKEQAYAGFPPRSGFIMLPRGTTRGARAGLALYEAVEPRQRLAQAVASLTLRLRLHRVLPDNHRPEVDWDWWEQWIAEIASPLVGPVAYVALRVPSRARMCALLLDGDGHPVGFAKVLDSPTPSFSADVRDRLISQGPRSFRIPLTLTEGQFEGVHYCLFEALPEGPHRRPPSDPHRVHAIIDEVRSMLATKSKAEGVPDHYVVCHTGFTPRNVRVTADGQWWVFDWDTARWGPRLAYELRYWAADRAYRLRPRVAPAAARVLQVLRTRGSDDEILEAVEWPGHRVTSRPIERHIYLTIASLIRSGGER